MWATTLVYVPVLTDLHAVARKLHPLRWSLRSRRAAGRVGENRLLVGAIQRLADTVSGLRGAGAGRRRGLLPLHNRRTALVKFTAGIDPYPVLTSYLGILLAGAMFLSLGLRRLQLGEESARRVDALTAAGAVLRASGSAAVVVRSGHGRLRSRVLPRRAGTLPTRLHPRHHRHTPLVMYVSITLCCLFLTVARWSAKIAVMSCFVVL